MTIMTCARCGAKNRVDESAAKRLKPVCGRCGARLAENQQGAAEDFRAAASELGKPGKVTDATFARDVLNAGSRPVLLDCWAEWCGPCRMIAPVLDQLAAESGNRYRVAKLNVDENPQTAVRLGIQSIPTLLIFKNGKAVDRIIGVQSKQAIVARLAAHL